MDIRQTSDEDKRKIIDHINTMLTKIIEDIKEVAKDMESEDLTIQAASVWIGNNLCGWYDAFKNEMHKLDAKVHDVQKEMQDADLIPQEQKGVIIQ